MTELDRLLNESESSRTRALLRAGKAETSPAGFAERLLASVGAAAAASAISSAAAASVATGTKVTSAATGSAVGAAVGSGAAPSLALVAAKWRAVGVLGGGILAAGADLALSPEREQQPAPQTLGANAPAANSPKPPTATPVAASTPTPATSAQPAPANLAPSDVRGSASTAPSASAGTSQLRREVELIERVRRALSAGNTSLALSELDAYQRVASTGVLDREARVLRIRALREGGDEAGARKLSDQYLLDFPSDPHASGLRARDAEANP
jgi:hypothetical protein